MASSINCSTNYGLTCVGCGLNAKAKLTVLWPFATSVSELWTHIAVQNGKEAGVSGYLLLKSACQTCLKRDCIFPLALHSGLGSAGCGSSTLPGVFWGGRFQEHLHPDFWGVS